MLCRSYATTDDARETVDRLLAAGVPGDAVGIVMGEPPRDARDGHHRGYAASTDADAPVGTFAGMPRAEREAMGAFAGDADARRGSYADADRDTVTTFPGGIATQRVTSRRALAALLREAGVDPEAVGANVRAVHAGRVLVLVDATAALAAAGTLDSG